MTQKNKSFGSFDNGFTMTFENGLVLSTRFGAVNYCENRAEVLKASTKVDNTPLFSDDAEVAVWLNNSSSNGSHDWENGWQEVVFGDADPSDDVRGWVTMAKWLQIVDWCRTWQAE